MSALSPAILDEFFGLCEWAYRCSIGHAAFFAYDEHAMRLDASAAEPGLKHLAKISKEYTLLQVAKLHDPVSRNGVITLGLEFVTQYGGWPRAKRAKLEELMKDLSDLLKDEMDLKNARNKVLAHNDLAAITAWLADRSLVFSGFADGLIEKYFGTLQEFIDVLFDGPRPFNASTREAMTILAHAIQPPA
jgi:branched-subunit amino acid aminotransferase/4-amino-4-deoxychorismate lyase